MTTAVPASAFQGRCGLRLALDVRADPLRYFTGLMNSAGPYTWLKLQGRPLVMLNDATGIEHVLQTNAGNYCKGHFNKLLKPLFGRSIFLHEGPSWRKRRQEAAPVFANGNFETMLGLMADAIEAMFRRWEPRIARGEPIDMTLEMTWFTLDAFLRALYHETKEGLASSMQSSLGVILKEAEDRMWAIASLPQVIAYRLPRYRKSMDFMREITRDLIANRQADRAYPEDLLSRLVEGLSEEQQSLHDEVLAYILAGHDTTAHAISWSLYTLSRFPAERLLLEAELDQVLDENRMSMQDIKELTYTRQVLDEVMRLYPPVWTMSREASGPDSIPLDDGSSLAIPTGAAVMMCQYAVHRREAYWPNPEAFDPGRFEAKAAAARPKYAWFPFGGGPRMCLGFRFAQVESVMALAMILQRYELSLIAGQHIEPQPIITLRPNGQVLYRASHKKQQPAALPTRLGMASPAAATEVSLCPFHTRQDNQMPLRKIPAS